MKYAKIKKCDVANGPGVRVSLFVSGCNHHCKNCFNREAWDFNYGNDFTEKEENQIIEDLKPEHISGLSLLGGEPFERQNQEGLAPLVKKIKQTYPNKKIWCYTGFTYEALLANSTTRDCLRFIDTLVDGPFIQRLYDPTLHFRGSSNQRILHLHPNAPTIAQEGGYRP